ncbi:MAG: hypothetical protein JXB60_08095 [Candidatus Cloacimonetes bacterium]|nr:hypothetical protein [Candidatus Cloacimonadota bacterium]
MVSEMNDRKREKKIKAALTAVMYYLDLEDNTKRKQNLWSLSGRVMIMKNRCLVQRKDLTFPGLIK